MIDKIDIERLIEWEQQSSEDFKFVESLQLSCADLIRTVTELYQVRRKNSILYGSIDPLDPIWESTISELTECANARDRFEISSIHAVVSIILAAKIMGIEDFNKSVETILKTIQ